MTIDFDVIFSEEFFAEYWRRKPLHVKGGALPLLGFHVDESFFLGECECLESRFPSLVFRKPGKLTFAQNLDLASARFLAASQCYAQHLAGVKIWIDGVYASQGSSIGSHYDIADSLVLQQKGTKIWKLHDPWFIPEAEMRQRMLNETDVDAMYMPDEAIEFCLEEGDCLYIPIFWVHWGIAVDRTLSVSVALTAQNALGSLETVLARGLHESEIPCDARDALTYLRSFGARQLMKKALWEVNYENGRHPINGNSRLERRENKPIDALSRGAALRKLCLVFRKELAHHEQWWSPLPVLPFPHLDLPPSDEAMVRVDECLDRIVSSFTEISLQNRLSELWQQHSADSSIKALPQTRLVSSLKGRQEPLLSDETMESFKCGPLDDFELPGVVIPALTVAEAHRLSEFAASQCVERFLRVCNHTYGMVREELALSLRTMVLAYLRLCQTRRVYAAGSGGIRAWLSRTIEAIHYGYIPRLEAIVRHLPSLLLPHLLDGGALNDGETVDLNTFTREELNFLHWGCRLVLNDQFRGTIKAHYSNKMLVFTPIGGHPIAIRAHPLAHTPSVLAETDGIYWEALPRVGSDGPMICGADEWVAGFFPKGARSHGIVLEPAPTQKSMEMLRESLETGLQTLDQLMPTAGQHVRQAVSVVVPLAAASRPERESTALFRGFMATFVKSPMMAARTLAREAARRVAYDLVDTYPPTECATLTRFTSPFSNHPQTLTELFPDLIANAQDAYLCKLLVKEKNDPETEVEKHRILSRCEIGISILKRHAFLTNYGRRVLEGLSRAVDEIQN